MKKLDTITANLEQTAIASGISAEGVARIREVAFRTYEGKTPAIGHNLQVETVDMLIEAGDCQEEGVFVIAAKLHARYVQILGQPERDTIARQLQSTLAEKLFHLERCQIDYIYARMVTMGNGLEKPEDTAKLYQYLVNGMFKSEDDLPSVEDIHENLTQIFIALAEGKNMCGSLFAAYDPSENRAWLDLDDAMIQFWNQILKNETERGITFARTLIAAEENTEISNDVVMMMTLHLFITAVRKRNMKEIKKMLEYVRKNHPASFKRSFDFIEDRIHTITNGTTDIDILEENQETREAILERAMGEFTELLYRYIDDTPENDIKYMIKKIEYALGYLTNPDIAGTILGIIIDAIKNEKKKNGAMDAEQIYDYIDRMIQRMCRSSDYITKEPTMVSTEFVEGWTNLDCLFYKKSSLDNVSFHARAVAKRLRSMIHTPALQAVIDGIRNRDIEKTRRALSNPAIASEEFAQIIDRMIDAMDNRPSKN